MKSQTPSSIETHWEKAAKTRIGKYLTHLETNFILQSIDPQKTHVVLDVGAEAGRFSLMTDVNFTAVGIDIDAYSLRRLKQKNKEVAVIQADARKIPFKSEIFDAVFMIEVLDYIPELSETFAECNRILKPKSKLVFSFGNLASYKAKLKGLRGKSYLHSYKKVSQYLFKTGFTVKKKMGYNWLPFGRISESWLVPISAGLEKFFHLKRIPSLSPWVLLAAEKSS